ncbi:MAG: hypothetical protein J5804_01195, partial [Eggerthellaceae bacterium]|nr:hypothetical protein [Eggerthellaceae bacterium]
RAHGPRNGDSKRIELAEPIPGTTGRWATRQLDVSRVGLPTPETDAPVCVAVPNAKSRLRVKGVENTVYSMGLPRNSFVDTGDGLAISAPELLFVEMAAELPSLEHLLLGMELLGTYTLDAVDPSGSKPKYGIAPATTIAALTSFVESAKGVVGLTRARRTLTRLVEGAWSPAEALIAALAVMPVTEDGYAMGPLSMNQRVETKSTAAHAASRVPDIVFEGSQVALNYDGEEHFALRDVADAVSDVVAYPGVAVPAKRLDYAIAQARARVVADKRRDRDLMVAGMTVLPVTREDLYEPGGLDFVMLQVMQLLEAQSGRDFSLQRMLLTLPYTRQHRQNRIWSLLPGPKQNQAREWLAKQEEPIPLPPASSAAIITFDRDGNIAEIREVPPETMPEVTQ